MYNIKNTVLDIITNTTDKYLLDQVLTLLHKGSVLSQLGIVLDSNPVSAKYTQQITAAVYAIAAPCDQKVQWMTSFPRGILDIDLMLDRKRHSFVELLGGNAFSVELFSSLCTTLVAQGVGPGELALAAFGRDIQWCGQSGGGGDIKIGSRAIEVKTTVSAGGRWVNTRKAGMNMRDIYTTVHAALVKDSAPAWTYPQQHRMGIDQWVYKTRYGISTADLPAVTQRMADGLFAHVPNSVYQHALAGGNSDDIKHAILSVGYDNYRKYSEFDGLLMICMKSRTMQYFENYSDMQGNIHASTPYIYCVEQEAMPKIILSKQ